MPAQVVAQRACHIEMNLAGHPVGKQDHYLVAFGGIICLDIAADGRVTVSPLGISVSTLEEFRNEVLLFCTWLTRRRSEILDQQKQDTQRRSAGVVEIPGQKGTAWGERRSVVWAQAAGATARVYQFTLLANLDSGRGKQLGPEL